MDGPGSLQWICDYGDLVAAPVASALASSGMPVLAAPIDADLADTAAFCEHYGVLMEDSANCVIIAGRRGDTVSYAACMVLATTRADVNGVVRRRLDARKASFAPMDDAVALSGMEYGGITPIGLPQSWPVLVDSAVVDLPYVLVGSGRRRGKLLVPGKAFAELPGAVVLEGLGVA